MANRTLLVLDPLRFACALMVVAHHYAAVMPCGVPGFLAPAARGLDLAAAQAGWAWPGWIGVEVFFVISGYVIALSLREGDAWAFARRRVLRLLPAALSCATLTAVVTCWFASVPLGVLGGEWLRGALLLPGEPLIDGSYWTLGAEVGFYLLAGLLVASRDDRRSATRLLAVALACVSAAFWLVCTAYRLAPPTEAIALTLLPHGGFFAIGILLARRHDGGRDDAGWPLGVAGVACVIEIVHRCGELSTRFALPDRPAIPLAIFATAVAAIGFGGRIQAPLGRIGAARLRFLGLVTYPLYLLHQHAGEAAIVLLRRAGAGWGVAQGCAAALVIVVAVLIVRVEPVLRRALAQAIDRSVSRFRGPVSDIPRTASLPAG